MKRYAIVFCFLAIRNICTYAQTEFLIPKPVVEINTASQPESFPFLSPDSKRLFYVQGIGQNSWLKELNMTTIPFAYINHIKNVISYTLSNDLKTLYLVEQGLDIYKVNRASVTSPFVRSGSDVKLVITLNGGYTNPKFKASPFVATVNGVEGLFLYLVQSNWEKKLVFLAREGLTNTYSSLKEIGANGHLWC